MRNAIPVNVLRICFWGRLQMCHYSFSFVPILVCFLLAYFLHFFDAKEIMGPL
jgi:hypothetical protein